MAGEIVEIGDLTKTRTAKKPSKPVEPPLALVRLCDGTIVAKRVIEPLRAGVDMCDLGGKRYIITQVLEFHSETHPRCFIIDLGEEVEL